MSRANPRFHRTNLDLPALPNSTTVELSIVGAIEQQMTVNTFHYNAPNVNLTPTDISGLIAVFITNVFPQFLACLNADWTGDSINGADVGTGAIASVHDVTIAGQVGGRAAGHEPTTVAAVISRYSGVKGQHGRGRLYLPAVSTADVTASTITAAAMKTAMSTLGARLSNTQTVGPIVWSPIIAQRSKQSPRRVVGGSPVLFAVPRFVLGTVRRRRLGRGK